MRKLLIAAALLLTSSAVAKIIPITGTSWNLHVSESDGSVSVFSDDDVKGGYFLIYCSPDFGLSISAIAPFREYQVLKSNNTIGAFAAYGPTNPAQTMKAGTTVTSDYEFSQLVFLSKENEFIKEALKEVGVSVYSDDMGKFFVTADTKNFKTVVKYLPCYK